jgi:cysteinyl-tRNA synthetase
VKFVVLEIYNTLTKRQEVFSPILKDSVNMFVCGLTVYDDAHMGHAKTFINFDIIARWLRRKGYKLKYIQNVTDVDDKIIKRAKERSLDPVQLARTYEDRFMEDMRALNIVENVDDFPRSHDYINEIAAQIQKLADTGYAYRLESDIYFNVAKFPDYTKLSGIKLEELDKHRIEPREGKINSYDFVLWKGRSDPEEPGWQIQIRFEGVVQTFDGRPGWHIEDTAIAHAFFGPQYDIHGGAIELLFPHHTNEVAEAEAAYGKKPYVKYWLHSGVLNVNSEKMSKSLGNFVRIRDVLEKYDADSVRLMVCSTNYRKDVDYKEETIKEAVRKIRYISSSLSLLYNMKAPKEGDDGAVAQEAERARSAFEDAMDDDFNTSLALSNMMSLIKKLRSMMESGVAISEDSKSIAMDGILSMCSAFGILKDGKYKKGIDQTALWAMKERESLRAAKKFKEADSLRDKIRTDFGIMVEDTEYGTVWYSSS